MERGTISPTSKEKELIHGMNQKVLIRQKFRDQVFTRDHHLCVICSSISRSTPATAAHHIIDRSRFPDGGYNPDNGASLCHKHHAQAESGLISCSELRRAAKIKSIYLPPDFDPKKVYDKWGRIIS